MSKATNSAPLPTHAVDGAGERPTRIDIVGAWLACLGAGTVLFAFNAPEWLGHATPFSDLQARASAGEMHGPVKAYFAFAGWIAFGLVVIAAALARYVPSRLRMLWASGAAVAALAAAAAAFAATKAAAGTTGLPDRIGPGVYVSMGGYLVLAASTVITRRVGRPSLPVGITA